MTHQKFFPRILLVSLFAVSLCSGCASNANVDPATKAKAKVAALIEKLKDEDEIRRWAAANALGEIGPMYLDMLQE